MKKISRTGTNENCMYCIVHTEYIQYSRICSQTSIARICDLKRVRPSLAVMFQIFSRLVCFELADLSKLPYGLGVCYHMYMYVLYITYPYKPGDLSGSGKKRRKRHNW